jgi:hypothetical protein
MSEAAEQDEPIIAAEGEGADANPEAAAEQEAAPPTLEEIASKFGWKEGGKLSAVEFLNETPKIMDRQRKKLDGVNKAMKVLEGRLHIDKQDSVRAKIAKAIEDGDSEAAEAIAREAVSPPGQRELADFRERNADWYDIDPEATAYVLTLDQQYARTFGTADPSAHFERIEKAVKKRFPELFEEEAPEAKKDEPPARRQPFVGGASRVAATKPAKFTEGTLTPEERKAADQFGVSYKAFAEAKNKKIEQEKAA